VLPGGTGGPTARGSHLITAPSVGFSQWENILLGGNGLLGVIRHGSAPARPRVGRGHRWWAGAGVAGRGRPVVEQDARDPARSAIRPRKPGLTSSRRTDRPAADPLPAEYHRGVSSGRRLSGIGGAFAFDTGSLTGTALLLAAPEPSTTWWHWVIRLREEKRLTGTVQATITPAEHGWAAEVAWVVGTPRQRRDIATEAALGHASPPSPLPPAWLPPITGTTGGSGRSFASRWGNAC
jgi:hypothetical protein